MTDVHVDGCWLINQVRRLPAEEGGGATPAAHGAGHSDPADGARVLRARFRRTFPSEHCQKVLIGTVATLATRAVAA